MAICSLRGAVAHDPPERAGRDLEAAAAVGGHPQRGTGPWSRTWRTDPLGRSVNDERAGLAGPASHCANTPAPQGRAAPRHATTAPPGRRGNHRPRPVKQPAVRTPAPARHGTPAPARLPPHRAHPRPRRRQRLRLTPAPEADDVPHRVRPRRGLRVLPEHARHTPEPGLLKRPVLARVPPARTVPAARGFHHLQMRHGQHVHVPAVRRPEPPRLTQTTQTPAQRRTARTRNSCGLGTAHPAPNGRRRRTLEPLLMQDS